MEVTVEISRRREASIRLVTSKGDDRDLRMRNAEAARGTTELEASEKATSDGSDNMPLNANTTT